MALRGLPLLVVFGVIRGGNKVMRKYLDNKYIQLLAISLLIIFSLSFVQDFSEFLGEQSDDIVKFGVSPACNIVTSICSASIITNGEFQKISLSVKKTSGSELTMELTSVGFDFEGIDSVSVSMIMPGAELEENRALFSPDKSNHLPVAEKWHLVLKLPEADKDRNNWLAVIRLKSSVREYRAEFPCVF